MMTDVHCRNCTKLLCRVQVFVGEIKCGRCNHVAEYRVLTERFIRQVQDAEYSGKPVAIAAP